ncbi:PDZ domain-containing protein [Conexibacter sp. W3-3-2]|nr:PDZ domain-containing protein [Conexibacter sp. W3-3-2]
MSWVIAFVGFAALIVLHEFGHFAAAKAVGMRVERFALFFPPILAKVRRGETEYGIGAIPLGGYVKITGMNPEEDVPEEVAHRAYYRQPVWKRIVVIAAGPLMNVLIAFVVLTGLYATQTLLEPTTRVEAIEPGAPAQGKLQPGDRVVSVDGRPVSSTEEISRQVSTHRCPAQQITGCSAAEPVALVVERDGRRVAVEVTPATTGRSSAPGWASASARRRRRSASAAPRRRASPTCGTSPPAPSRRSPGCSTTRRRARRSRASSAPTRRPGSRSRSPGFRR